MAKVYGVKSPIRKETTRKQQLSTEELMKDPFAGVKPGFPTSRGHVVKPKVWNPYSFRAIYVENYSLHP